MQRRRAAILAVVWALCVSAAPASVWAVVHGGGVGACNVCHAMHGTDSGTPGPGPGGGGAGGSLLIDGPASDICLSCHASAYGAVLGADPLAPPSERGPGNFVFLTEDNLNDGPDGILAPIVGDAAGHNVHAPGHGLATDGTVATSPGGTYPANNLRCTSCHDPHGNGNYRFLRDPATAQGSGGIFSFPAPLAAGLDVEVGGTESGANHVAYLAGMSAWCGNCHGAFLNDHADGTSAFGHPTDRALENEIIQQYEIYNGTADPTGGQAATSYLAEVPFEDAANTITSTSGPAVSSRLMCLTCHRAHASSAPASGRWDFNVTTLGEDGVISGSYPLPNPYTDLAQDPLCFKCHDTGTH